MANCVWVVEIYNDDGWSPFEFSWERKTAVKKRASNKKHYPKYKFRIRKYIPEAGNEC